MKIIQNDFFDNKKMIVRNKDEYDYLIKVLNKIDYFISFKIIFIGNLDIIIWFKKGVAYTDYPFNKMTYYLGLKSFKELTIKEIVNEFGIF